MNEITITPEAIAEAAGAEQMLMAAQAYQITTVTEYTAAGEELKRIKGKAKSLEERRVSMTKPLDESRKRIMEFFRQPLMFLADAELAIKRSLGAYDEDLRRQREEAERLAAEVARKERERMQADAAKQEQAARAKREAEEAKARALEAQGRAVEADAKRQAAAEREALRLREAEALRAAAESMPQAPVVHMEAPKVAGVSTRQAWKYQVTDFRLLPREYLIADDSAIGKVVRALGDRTNIPGIRVYAETIISSRSV